MPRKAVEQNGIVFLDGIEQNHLADRRAKGQRYRDKAFNATCCRW